MLSNKMTFSLMSLITIIALAFVVPSAMAQDFAVELDTTGDISTAAGLQVRHPADNMLEVTLKSAEAIELPAANVFVTTYDRLGNLVSIPGATVDTEDASKEFVLTIEVTDAVTKVNIKINEGIASADPLSTKKSKKVNIDVHLLAVDDPDVAPRVYSIRRVDNPLVKATADTLQVIITLSEQPKSFKKANVSVSNATHGDPVALEPVAENVVGLNQLESSLAATGILDPARPMPLDADGIRGVISRALTLTPTAASGAGTITDLTGLQSIRKVYEDGITGEDAADLSNLTALHVALDTAITTLAGGTATAINYLNDDGELQTDLTVNNSRQTAEVAADAVAELDPANIPVAMKAPTTQGTADLGAAPNIIPMENFDRSAEEDSYTEPNPADFDNVAAITQARAVYDLLIGADADGQRTDYTEEKAVYDAYMEISDAIEMIELDALAMWEQDELVPAAAQTSAPRIPGSNPLPATGPDGMLHEFVLTLTPTYPAGKPDIVVKVNEFANTDFPEAKMYVPPTDAEDYVEGFDKLTIQVDKVKSTATTAGIEVVIGKGVIIPKDGYLVVAKSKAGSAVRDPGDAKKAPANPPRKPFGLTYNLVEGGLPNLETLLLNGGTIDIVGPKKLVISEIMWGSDASIANSFESQYIELRNTSGAAITAGDKNYKLVLYTAGATLPDASVAANNIQDRAGTVGAHGRWSPINKGQSGRTGVGEAPGDVVAITPTQALISMQRSIDATGVVTDGTDPMSWAGSVPPGVNFDPTVEGERVGSPGRAPHTYPTAPTPPTPPAPATPAAKASDIMITEIMVDSDSGRLPQWIELTHVGTGEVSLDGWEMVIDNAIDADVIGGGNAITVSLSGATLDVSAHTGNTGKGQSVLVVAWAASRKSANIRDDRIINIATQLNQTRRYQLLSYKGFRVTLVPPQTGAIAAFGDVAGNLDEEWELPMDEGTARSSMIRREMAGTPAAATMGTDAKGWTLASSTALITGQQSYYGSDEDAGTPGQDAGGPLPVELSHFRPARDKETGAVVITWSTQSELNNAGFFIKRSNQRNGQFQVVNATMVPGAGTTSEKQFYTYTDTTAQPNVVYYYQIEDVSLDGNRQLLTRGIRLKGHIGAAGKATVTWGELKTSHE